MQNEDIPSMTNVPKRAPILTFAFFILTFAFLSRAQPQSTLPPMMQGVGLNQNLNAQLPLDLELKDETGRMVKMGSYFGKKPVILTLVYYQCPMLCTYVLNGLVRSMRALSFDAGKEFDIVTVSFDSRETPSLALAKKQLYLKEYARAGAENGWHFFTADQNSIDLLTQAAGFKYKYDPKQDQFAHASGIMVATPEGKLARYFYGVEYPPRDLRLALVEASENKIGSLADQVLLFCFHYDPSTGKYGAYALNLVRLGGVITVVCLGLFIVRSRYKEKELTTKTRRH